MHQNTFFDIGINARNYIQFKSCFKNTLHQMFPNAIVNETYDADEEDRIWILKWQSLKIKLWFYGDPE